MVLGPGTVKQKRTDVLKGKEMQAKKMNGQNQKNARIVKAQWVSILVLWLVSLSLSAKDPVSGTGSKAVKSEKVERKTATAVTTAKKEKEPSATGTAPAEKMAPVVGRVTANRLNVRARPGKRYEVVGQLRRNKTVRIVDKKGEWLGIIAPSDTAAWLPVDAVRDGRITARQVPVYSGPGAVYSSYAILVKGDRVEKIRIQADKWLKIRPPADAVVWVSRDYVAVPSAVVPRKDTADGVDKTEKSPSPSPVTPPVHPRIHQIEPAPTAALTFIGTPRPVVRRGIVVPIKQKKAHWSFVLAILVHDTYYPIAYLQWEGHEKELAQWKWHKIIANGTLRWVQGWPRPLIQLERVEPGEAAETTAPGTMKTEKP